MATLPRRARHTAWAAALLACVAARPLAAQPTTTAPPSAAAAGPRVGALVAGLRRGARVRVIGPEGQVEGGVEGAAGDTLLVRTAGAVRRTPAAAITALWVRDRRHTRGGAKIGAVLGGVALGGFALFLTQALCDSPGGCEFGRDGANAVLVGTAVGAVGGATVGALAGAAVPAWRQVYP